MSKSSQDQVSESDVSELRGLINAAKKLWRQKRLCLAANEKSKKKLVLRPILEADDEELGISQDKE